MGDALRADALDVALRRVDRAWRSLTVDAATLAPIYGRLLMLEGRDFDAALGLLQRALDAAPDPELAALAALATLRLDRPEDARRQLDSALAQFCVAPDGLLSGVCGLFMQHPAIDVPGWIGRGPKLELVGELAEDEPSNVLDIGLDGGPAFAQLIRPVPAEGRRAFGLKGAQRKLDARLEVSCRGAPLLGSGSRIPPDYALDGRVESSGRRVSGWARVGWSPLHPARLRVVDEDGHRCTLRTHRVPDSGRRWRFSIDLRTAGLRGSRLHVSARLPDGRWQPLPESPLLLEPAVRLVRRPGSRARPAELVGRHARLTDVIVPVHGGREETLACIDAVLATLDETARLVVVDDATDDPVLVAALDALAARGRIRLLRNAENRGFVASVNRALALEPTHDAVLLNSDTRVFDDWLARLRLAAYSGDSVGTATPFSNEGSIASYPRAQGGAPIRPEAAAALHALAASVHGGIRAEIPVGVGFCLYLRRDCLRDVGELDAAVFGKGYGEESDFCLRARRRGWSHVLAADVFVYHAGAVSFGGRRAALLHRSQRLLNLRHPGYDRLVGKFLTQDPLHRLRRRLDERRLAAFEGRFVLMVTLALTGGVQRFVTERCRGLRAQGLFPLVLRPTEAGNARRCELWTDALELPNLRYEIPADLSSLSALLRALPIEAVEIQHFLHLDARVIDAVRALPIPYDVFVHDYAWICPRVTLIDGSGRYCGEPAVSVCQACVRRNGSHLGENITVPALRARSAKWLRAARRVVAPTHDTAGRMRRHFRDLQVDVQPHALPVALPPPSARVASNRVLRVALIGAIGQHKGYRILLRCARDARARRLPIEFVVIGYTENDAPLLATGKVFITGRYGETEAAHLLEREQPDVAWLPSVWPETWCYTLDYALGLGLPVAAFDLGAIAERLRAAGLGELLPLGLEPRHINDRLLQLGAGAKPRPVTESRSVQSALPRAPDDAKMMPEKSHGMRMIKTSSGKPAREVQPAEGLSASVQVLPLPPGLYLFSVKAAAPTPPSTAGQLSLPAMHVGLGPGVRSDQVEFISHPSTHGAWLFAARDLLVVKISGTGATLILTSVRAPGGEVLSIKVESLDARAEETSVAPPVPNRDDRGEVQTPSRSVFHAGDAELPLRVQIGAHLRTRGDMTFADVPWAGRVAPGLWIESFSVRPLERFGAEDIEYKGLTGSGFETPWVSDDKACGTKGMATPLVGFAIRLKAAAAAAAYDCEYSGYFQSGTTVGPLRNGAPCRSSVANDSLEGIQLRLVKRAGVSLPVAEKRGVSAPAKGSTPTGHRKAKAAASLKASRGSRGGRRQSTRGP